MKRPLEDPDDDNDTGKNPIVFLDVAIDGEKVGRIIIELFKDTVPRTAENFRALCTGEKGIGIHGKKLHYKGSIFHKIVPQFMIQGGDIVNFDGTSGESIYGGAFEDESFELLHSVKGLLSMVNEGKPNTNSSQFIITIEPSPHLDNTNVVFGKVIRGLGIAQEVNEGVFIIKDKPVEKVEIIDCGELTRGENWGIYEDDGTLDIYTSYPEDWDYVLNTDEEKIDAKYVMEVVEQIKSSGNYYFDKKNYSKAGKKYKKSLRFYDWLLKRDRAPEDLLEPLQNLRNSIMLNASAVEIKLGRYREALKLCNNVLANDKNSSKALFRRSQSYMGLNEYELSLDDLKAADTISPNNREILREIERVKKTIKSYLIVEKTACKRMFKLS
ncbi:peptidyl-prolyl cis-trans isomerase D [Fopius arisanus]|uniref:peptidylprolyl isomerase n=1 Tax=Fopius arisanus TaxID=64838 RepID=A0A9R1U2Q5_9HYME|nr:PREDICTED: peptidyl-prolyl cis-trans isomerase D [Fopius arisanus]